MLHKDYDRKSSVAKKVISGRDSQGSWIQDEPIAGNHQSQSNSDSDASHLIIDS
jgi:hypothetical protein